ncbi:hypothetical protein H0O00_03495 [Candidatus Micrarchaeota archaeon]|nr:hypothetical protein [Candidatus Micrarchaeota archaeon]
MRIFLFFKLMLIAVCLPLLWFALSADATLVEMLKMMALGTVASVAVTTIYPEVRGIKSGDVVAVVADERIPSLIGRPGRAVAPGRKNDKIKITLDNGSEVFGVIESYNGLISPPKVRILYEEKLVD